MFRFPPARLVFVVVFGLVFSLCVTTGAGAQTKQPSVTDLSVEEGLYASESTEVLVAVSPEDPNDPAIPQGSVQLREGNDVLGSATLDDNGEGSVMLGRGFARGPHTVKAVYAGDASWEASESDPASFNVSGYKLTSSLNSSKIGGSGDSNDAAKAGEIIAFNASFAIRPDQPQPPGGIVPSGSVTFTDVCNGCGGSQNLGTAPVQNGKASISTSGLAAGTHSVSAAYAGDSNFEPVSAGPVTQVVVAAPAGAATPSISKAAPLARASKKAQKTIAVPRASTAPVTAVDAGVPSVPSSQVVEPPSIQLPGTQAALPAAEPRPGVEQSHDRTVPARNVARTAGLGLLAAALASGVIFVIFRKVTTSPR